MFWVYKAERSETNFCGAIGLRETKRLAVLGWVVLVEMKPIFCDWKTKPHFGGFQEVRETQVRLFLGHGAEGKESNLCWVVR